MGSMARVWSTLPPEILERVLLFLPLPALMRARSVCRRWDELLRKPSFLELCNLSGRHKPYLYFKRQSNGYGCVDDGYRRTACFLDLDERRWYSIPVDASLLAPTDESVIRHLAMDDGLICELSALQLSKEYKLVMFDPIAKTRWELPASTREDGPMFFFGDALPAIVTVVDNTDRSFKVFVMSKRSRWRHTGFFVYESSTNAWRALANPPERLDITIGWSSGRMIEESAVFFQGKFYAIFRDYANSTIYILSYTLGENLWSEPYLFESRHPGYPHLSVVGNSLFLAMWVDGRSLPSSFEDLEDSAGAVTSAFEIKEILVDENSNRTLVRIPTLDLQRTFGHPTLGLKDLVAMGYPTACLRETCIADVFSDLHFDIAYGFPLNSCSVVLFSRLTGRLISYDIQSGSIGALPENPLIEEPVEHAWVDEEEVYEDEVDERDMEDELPPHYNAKLVNLSLRNILTRGPVTSSSRV